MSWFCPRKTAPPDDLEVNRIWRVAAVEFSLAEMERRRATTRRLMEAAGIDTLLLSGIENVSYHAGVPTSLNQTRRPWCLVVPLVGDVVGFMMGHVTGSTLARHGYVDDVEAYALPVSGNLPAKVVARLTALKARRIGCEFGLETRIGMPLDDFDTIRRGLPDAAFVDASSIIWQLRMYKSAEEIARMRSACDITGRTRQELFKEVRAGMTEREVADLWRGKMLAAGAESASFIYVNTGDTADLLPSTDKKLTPGETLWVDGGVYIGGYTCDFSRIATLGEPSDRQRLLHRDAVEVVHMIMDEVRPGMRVADLAAIGAAEMARRGHTGIRRRLEVNGHGMGMLINEPPLLAPWDETVLAEGMTVGIELGPVESDGMFIWEDLVHVTATGHDLITTEATDLAVVEV
jgi:Xaa-Pro aminopeptidase